MVASELRANARQSLKGKWGKAALLFLCFGLINFVISFVISLIPVIGPIAYFIISLPFYFGFIASFMKLKRDEEVSYTDFLNIGFSNFGKVWGVFGNLILKLIIPYVLVIIFVIIFVFSIGASITSLIATSYTSLAYTNAIAGFGAVSIIAFIGYIASLIYLIVKGYSYSLIYFILYDNPDKTGKEIVEESESLMKGNRWSFFWLILTFLGWFILSIFTLYIGMLWLAPYIFVAQICFYDALAGKSSKAKTEESNPIVEE